MVAEGGILYQVQDGVDRVVGYASRTFSAAERRSFSNPERESHVIMWGVCHVWKHILNGRIFEVYSDHKPCLALKAVTKLTNERMQRWATMLSSFRLTSYYEKGEKMVDCEALSRAAYIEYDPFTKTHVQDPISRTLEVGALSSVMSVVYNQVTTKRTPEVVIQANVVTAETVFSADTVREEQRADQLLHDIICVLEELWNPRPTTS